MAMGDVARRWQYRECFCTLYCVCLGRLPALPGSCATEGPLQLDCGHRGVSRDACHQLGCCYDARKLTCYYKLNGGIIIILQNAVHMEGI